MNKLLILFATLLPCGALVLARQSATDIPQRVEASPNHRLRMRIEGNGPPNVVMEIGLAGVLEEWALVQSGVAKFARVAAYDRNGSNFADGPQLSGTQIARDLHAALANANIVPPYVLVGQSFGGVYCRVFAEMYPCEIAGIVLIESPTQEFIDWMEVHHPDHGLASFRKVHWPEAAGIRTTLGEVKSVGPLPDVPVVVVSGARRSDDPLRREVQPIWIRMNEAWAKTVPQGRHVLAERSGHGVQIDQPELVIELIHEVVERLRHD